MKPEADRASGAIATLIRLLGDFLFTILLFMFIKNSHETVANYKNRITIDDNRPNGVSLSHIIFPILYNAIRPLAVRLYRLINLKPLNLFFNSIVIKKPLNLFFNSIVIKNLQTNIES